ncbi:ParB N-terminal domain-containing protein [Mesorhizobium sp. M1312]|uniref:ParB/RepB/Spo0J family partition protein n=1 Tax=unclassified Mesorhizobium TaxID=325217 RepID=UPI003336619A
MRARGVLVPLLVLPNGQPETFEIVAGRRRYFAAKSLADERGEGDPLPCAIMEDDDDADALEASLIENLARLDPDGVSQWETFSRLVRQGRTVPDIAATFGITDLKVKRIHGAWRPLAQNPRSLSPRGDRRRDGARLPRWVKSPAESYTSRGGFRTADQWTQVQPLFVRE